MAQADLRNLFGLAITTVYIRSSSYSPSIAKRMCEALSAGFGLSVLDGDTAFTYFRTEGQPQNSRGFNDNPYIVYEQETKEFLSANMSASDEQLTLLAIAAQAMLFSYTINSAIEVVDFQILMGKVLAEVSEKVLGAQLFQNILTADKGYMYVTPYTDTVILAQITTDYSITLYLLGGSEKTSEAKMTNYNWYDTNQLLAGPDLSLMRDVENQYYYISGALIYEGAYGTVGPCEEDITTISTATGDATFSYLRNIPCREVDSYIGPVERVVFNRTFNDGPSSSGRMTQELVEFYRNNDKEKLVPKDYLSNSYNMQTYTGQNLASVFVDANGRYSLTTSEYDAVPRTFNCNVPYDRMHIGDNRPRYICDNAKDCNCSLINLTGFKFASLEIPDKSWSWDLQFRQTNPLSETKRIYTRSWNIANSPYLSTDAGDGTLLPYWTDPDPPYTQHWYVGYPLLDGSNQLPQLAFFQTFSSSAFHDSPSVTIYPAIGAAGGTVTQYAESQRAHVIGDIPLFSGISEDLPIRLSSKISANLTGQTDDIKKFFGMGTAFDGKYSISVVREENAGFFYSGVIAASGDLVVNLNSLLPDYDASILCPHKTIKYISGYERLSDGKIYELNNFFCYNNTGETFTYTYLDPLSYPELTLPTWQHFAHAPTELQNESKYRRIYAEQTLENYWPRYFAGPFSVETRKFLYPNAALADTVYVGKERGMPTGIKFKVTIREEAVREIYCKYEIRSDGYITPPNYTYVTRSDILSHHGRNPKMHTLFVPDDPNESMTYNYLYWDTGHVALVDSSSGINGVDDNWAPSETVGINTYVPVSRNSNVYNLFLESKDYFRMGVKKKNNGVQAHRILGPNSSVKITHSIKPLSDGVWHTFKYHERSGKLIYTLPIFNIAKNRLDYNAAMSNTWAESWLVSVSNPRLEPSWEGMRYYNWAGTECLAHTGQEQLFAEYIGGRRGGETAQSEGGYHSKGIIGDKWLGCIYDAFGIVYSTCYNGAFLDWIPKRAPGYDSNLMLFNSTPSGTDLWTNGFSFSPYTVTRNKTPLNPYAQYSYQADSNQGYLTTESHGEFIKFSLHPFFPLKNRTGEGIESQSYYRSGLFIGPFDTDVELGIASGEALISYSEFYLNDEKLSHFFASAGTCEAIWNYPVSIGETIACGEPFYAYHPRNKDYSILCVIPAGQRAKINIVSNTDSSTFTYSPESYPPESLTKIGIPSEVTLSLRTHVPLDADDYIEDGTYTFHIQSGEDTRLRPELYTNNGMAKKYELLHNGFEGLARTFSFTNDGPTSLLYPIPDETNFKQLAGSQDQYGNWNYSWSVQQYWRSFAQRNNCSVFFSGIREGGRIAFEITNLELLWDVLLYQQYDVVTPSGDCYLSGEFGYTGQADNTIYTEGFKLVNTTTDDELAESYNPSFVSNVLARLPANYFITPVTEDGSAPVLEAPSVMKQRLLSDQIVEGQQYSLLLRQPPDNYNKLLWPALSDLETMNPGETIETIPPGDGLTFPNSSLLFSASQGQRLPNGDNNPNIVKQYTVTDIFQMYDSVATDALINSGACITSRRGTSVVLSQDQMSGALLPVGTPLTFLIKGLL